MNALLPAVAGLAFLREDAIHRASGTEIPAFVQQGGLHGGRGTILKALFMQDVEHLRALVDGEGPCRPRAWSDGHRLNGHRRRAQDRALPIETGANYAEAVTSGADPDRRSQGEDGVQRVSFGSAGGSGHPNSAPTFF